MNNTTLGKELPNKAARHKLFATVNPVVRTKPTRKKEMSDLQNIKKDFLFDLDVVGITKVKHPITINSNLQPSNQTTVGTFQFSTSIKQTSKGTNMSRFTEQLNLYHERGFIVDFSALKTFTKELAERLEQDDATMRVDFPWFFERRAPQSKLMVMNYDEL